MKTNSFFHSSTLGASEWCITIGPKICQRRLS